MKVFINNKVYVQIKDILFISRMLSNIKMECPKSVLVRMFQIIRSNENKYNFIEFSNKEEIDFFKKLDFIISYKEYKNITHEKMTGYIENIGNDLYILAEKFQDLSEKEQENKYEKYQALCEEKYYKMESIREIYKISIGELSIDLPKKEKMFKKIFSKNRKG